MAIENAKERKREERVKNTTKRTNLHVFTFTLGARCTLYVEAEAPFLFSRVKMLRSLHSLCRHTLHRRIAGTVFEKDVESRESRAVSLRTYAPKASATSGSCSQEQGRHAT